VKWCPHCARFRARDAFGFDIARDDGLSGWCRACRAENSRERRAADRETDRRITRARYHANPAKWHAKIAVARAVVRGIIRKPAACPTCHRITRVEAHHHRGYAREHWLDVVWRCRQCHTLEHKRGLSGRSDVE
jgi:hypothetical protein